MTFVKLGYSVRNSLAEKLCFTGCNITKELGKSLDLIPLDVASKPKMLACEVLLSKEKRGHTTGRIHRWQLLRTLHTGKGWCRSWHKEKKSAASPAQIISPVGVAPNRPGALAARTRGLQGAAPGHLDSFEIIHPLRSHGIHSPRGPQLRETAKANSTSELVGREFDPSLSRPTLFLSMHLSQRRSDLANTASASTPSTASASAGKTMAPMTWN
jgi:hypothetical protein